MSVSFSYCDRLEACDIFETSVARVKLVATFRYTRKICLWVRLYVGFHYTIIFCTIIDKRMIFFNIFSHQNQNQLEKKIHIHIPMFDNSSMCDLKAMSLSDTYSDRIISYPDMHESECLIKKCCLKTFLDYFLCLVKLNLYLEMKCHRRAASPYASTGILSSK